MELAAQTASKATYRTKHDLLISEVLSKLKTETHITEGTREKSLDLHSLTQASFKPDSLLAEKLQRFELPETVVDSGGNSGEILVLASVDMPPVLDLTGDTPTKFDLKLCP